MNPSAARTHQLLGVYAILHSTAVSGLSIMANAAQMIPFPMPPILWAAAWCSWFCWPFVLVLHRGRSFWRVALPILISLLILAASLKEFVFFVSVRFLGATI